MQILNNNCMRLIYKGCSRQHGQDAGVKTQRRCAMQIQQLTAILHEQQYLHQ